MLGKKENLFDLQFRRNPNIPWKITSEGKVELQLENTGFFNEIAQKFFKRPRYSFIELDEFGSFVWLSFDKQHDIISISEGVKEHFGEKAEPLLPRLGRFFQILLDNKLIEKF